MNSLVILSHNCGGDIGVPVRSRYRDIHIYEFPFHLKANVWPV